MDAINLKASSSREFLLVAAAAVLVVFLYEGALTGPFVFDDEPNITRNRRIRITDLDPAGLYSAAFRSPLPTRPVANASFALNYYFNGYNVVGYRFINILIHMINGFLLFGLARVTLQTPVLKNTGEKFDFVAALAALVWMVHPLHTQSVGYVVQRMTSLATLFYLLSMLCYASARLSGQSPHRRIGLFLGCGLAGLLSLTSKEIAATLPVLIFLYEWYFFQGLSKNWLRRRLPALAAVCILTAAIGLLYLGTQNPVEKILAPYSDGGMSAGQRLLTQLRVVCFYISLLFWPAPSRLNLDHDFPFSRSLLDPAATLAALLLLAGLLIFAVILARRNPLGSYAILWFLGNLVIESSLIRLETVFEHRTYLPSVIPLFALTASLFRVLRRKWAAGVLLVALAICWAGWTWQRSQVWGDAVVLWQDCVNKSPGKARPYNNLGSAFSERGQLPEAAACFRKAIELRPDYGDAHYNLGYALVRLGQLGEGIHQLLEAVRLVPENPWAHNNLGVAYLLQENYPQAIPHLQRAVDLDPVYETARNNLAVALKYQGDLEGAIHHLEVAVRIHPDYAEAFNNLGLTLKEHGNLEAAAENFRRALQINPSYPAARQNLEATEQQLQVERTLKFK
jgi:tetratricopeptide (TPR) repeat protein